MFVAVTDGIKVSVEVIYQPDYSNPENQHYVFTYQVTIENQSDFTIQLISRKWLIVDSNGQRTEVAGEGVVGQQPILEPGEVHQYVSGSNLKTSIGKMGGHYVMERILDNGQFQVTIPDFSLIAPFKLN